jgi:hypothetical protein
LGAIKFSPTVAVGKPVSYAGGKKGNKHGEVLKVRVAVSPARIYIFCKPCDAAVLAGLKGLYEWLLVLQILGDNRAEVKWEGQKRFKPVSIDHLRVRPLSPSTTPVPPTAAGAKVVIIDGQYTSSLGVVSEITGPKCSVIVNGKPISLPQDHLHALGGDTAGAAIGCGSAAGIATLDSSHIEQPIEQPDLACFPLSQWITWLQSYQGTHITITLKPRRA